MSCNDRVSVTIVTFNSGRFIKRCLESVLAQRYANKEIIVIDNASTDGTMDILEQFVDRCRVVYNDENIGFAAAQNQAIRMSSGEWVLTLNPDVLLLPNFIQALADAGNGSQDRDGVRKAADHPRQLRFARQAAGGFHGHLFHSHAAPSGSRQPGSGQRALSQPRICFRRHRRRGASIAAR
jgi:glycosyltransferase involved in cell wall biosynthesis